MCLLQPLACNHIQVTPVRRTDAVYLPCTLKKKKRNNTPFARSGHFVSGDLKSFAYAQLAS